MRGVRPTTAKLAEAGIRNAGPLDVRWANASAAPLTRAAMAIELEVPFVQLQVALGEGAANSAASIDGLCIGAEAEDGRPGEFPARAVIACARSRTILVGKDGDHAAGERGCGSQKSVVGRVSSLNIGGAGEIDEIYRIGGARYRA